MTKLRTPDSIEDACTQASALLGAETIAMVLSAKGLRCSASLVTKWCDGDAPQTPSCEQALALDQLLIKTGHEPVFLELFTRQRPQAMAAEPAAPNPVREAMAAVKNATDLMVAVDQAMIDGKLQRHELNHIEKQTNAAQRQLARLRRCVRAALDLPKAR